MAFRFEFEEAAARDLRQLTKRNHPLLLAIVTEYIPAILRDPYGAGEKKKGDLAHIRAYNMKLNNVVYRLAYMIEDDVIIIVAIGEHDTTYTRAARRR